MSSHLYDESGMPIPQNYSRQSQSNYNLGASVSIPLEKLFDLRGSVKRQRKPRWKRSNTNGRARSRSGG